MPLSTSHDGMRSDPMRSDPMKWDTDMRIGLRTLVFLTSKEWDVIRDLWYQEFSSQATGKRSDARLKHCLRSQYSMKDRITGQKQWSKVGTTLQELQHQAPALVARLQTAYDATLPTRRRIQHATRSKQSSSSLSKKKGTGTVEVSIQKTFARPVTSPRQESQPSEKDNVAESGTKSRFFSSTHAASALETDNIVSANTHPSLAQAPSPASGRYVTKEAHQSREEYLLQRRTMDHGPPRQVNSEAAHPPLPVLFYRYYDTATTHVGNFPATQGFISGFYNGPPIHQGYSNPPDPSDDRLVRDIEVHVNMRKFPPTPFVSVTSNLHWVLTAATQKAKKGQDMRISIIDAQSAAGENGHRAYHVQAYYDQLRERAAFDDFAKMMYRGTYEYLIWAYIPASAIVADFSYDALKQFSLDPQKPYVHDILRLGQLEIRGQGGSDSIRRAWQRRQPVDLLENSTQNFLLDTILWLFCRNPANVPLVDALTKLISDLTSGWGIRPSRALSRNEWTEIAINFSASMHSKFDYAITRDSLYHIAKAFLFGIASGLGEPNWYFDQAQKDALFAAMAQYGLEQPDDMLSQSDNALVAGIRSMMHAYVPALPAPAPKTPRRKITTSDATMITTPTPIESTSSLRSSHFQTPARPSRRRDPDYMEDYMDSPSVQRRPRPQDYYPRSRPRRRQSFVPSPTYADMHRDWESHRRPHGHFETYDMQDDYMDYEYSDHTSPW